MLSAFFAEVADRSHQRITRLEAKTQPASIAVKPSSALIYPRNTQYQRKNNRFLHIRHLRRFFGREIFCFRSMPLLYSVWMTLVMDGFQENKSVVQNTNEIPRYVLLSSTQNSAKRDAQDQPQTANEIGSRQMRYLVKDQTYEHHSSQLKQIFQVCCACIAVQF